MASCIRLLFAMARDGRLPFGTHIARVSGSRRVPVVPALVVGILALAILAVNIGNQSAFLALTSVAIVMFYIAYLGVTGGMLVKRLRGEWPRPDHGPYFSLGRWGLLVNAIAVVYGAIVAINIAWPRSAVYDALAGTKDASGHVIPGHWYWQYIAVLFIGIVVAGRLGVLLRRVPPQADRGPARARRRGPAAARDRCSAKPRRRSATGCAGGRPGRHRTGRPTSCAPTRRLTRSTASRSSASRRRPQLE